MKIVNLILSIGIILLTPVAIIASIKNNKEEEKSKEIDKKILEDLLNKH